MPRYRADDDDWDDEDDDYGADGYGDDDDPTIECPGCHADVYEDAERCPKCGLYLTGEDAAQARSTNFPMWVKMTALIILGYTIWAFLT